MTKQAIQNEESSLIKHRSKGSESNETTTTLQDGRDFCLQKLQQQVGNREVQRLLAQYSGKGLVELDDDTADRINSQRGAGQTLDSAVQKQVGEAMGQDFNSVRVHTSPQSDDLNKQLGAKAFTTGREIFFREGAYQPQTSGGQELIAHELTHVVQQSEGRVPAGSGKLTVRPPGDAFEQEADAVARAVTSGGVETGVQRQIDDEEEALQAKPLQRQELEEEEDLQLQRQELAEEEEELLT